MVLWVFGYGSIKWNPGFDFDEKLIGYIKDYKRARTPEHPARTCTLEQSTGAIWEKLAMEYLERRECEYDSKNSCRETVTSEPILTGVIVVYVPFFFFFFKHTFYS
ncbi:hypothetical protein BRARA_F02786 [Brassica rapa]|uniref:Uncharacterized protein n=1 Tax=Brassica campestris TaxID=3711 RepID=A0A397Z1V6_BRACM|nr:hypothetical protein BRARA_F02786 [Brassica rapa]